MLRSYHDIPPDELVGSDSSVRDRAHYEVGYHHGYSYGHNNARDERFTARVAWMVFGLLEGIALGWLVWG